MKRLSAEAIVDMHRELIAQSGGLDGVRNRGLLDFSVNASFQTFGGVSLYPTLPAKAAHLAFSLVHNHPFLDGNKRIGLLSMLVFLEINGFPLTYTDDELVALGLQIAEGRIDESGIADWIICHN
jgi:death-on-curing protein